jgi:hypothetical protein
MSGHDENAESEMSECVFEDLTPRVSLELSPADHLKIAFDNLAPAFSGPFPSLWAQPKTRLQRRFPSGESRDYAGT